MRNRRIFLLPTVTLLAGMLLCGGLSCDGHITSPVFDPPSLEFFVELDQYVSPTLIVRGPTQVIKLVDSGTATRPLTPYSETDWLWASTLIAFRSGPNGIPNHGAPISGEWVVHTDITDLSEGTHTATLDFYDYYGEFVATVPVTLTISDSILAGDWQPVSLTYINHNEPSEQVEPSYPLDLMQLAITADGTYTYSIIASPSLGYPGISISGSLAVEGYNLLIDLDQQFDGGQYSEFAPFNADGSVLFTYTSGQFTVSDSFAEYDFDGDGITEPATVVVVFETSAN